MDATTTREAAGACSDAEPCSDAGSGPSSGLTQTIVRFVEELILSTDRLIEVYADRLRLSARQMILRAVLVAGIGVCAGVWLGAAALAILRGACGGMTALCGGREWLGDLTAGVLAFALAAALVATSVHVSSRRELARLKAKYEREPR